jgi:hypothetical protein
MLLPPWHIEYLVGRHRRRVGRVRGGGRGGLGGGGDGLEDYVEIR